jgi:hypothetical protein
VLSEADDDIITGGVGTDTIVFEAATLTDWVKVEDSGSDSALSVDIDGTARGNTWVQIATIYGVTGLTDEAALVTAGNLIVS